MTPEFIEGVTKCLRCKKSKPSIDFYFTSDNHYRHSVLCKQCRETPAPKPIHFLRSEIKYSGGRAFSHCFNVVNLSRTTLRKESVTCKVCIKMLLAEKRRAENCTYNDDEYTD